MHISHVGQASLLTHKQKSLHLRNVLRVPSATRSLLSVPQLTRDNNVFTEFHPSYFLSRIGPRGTFCLEVACAMDYMHLICLLPLEHSLVSVCRLLIGMHGSAILPLP